MTGSAKGVGLDPGQNRSGWKQKFSASVGAVALPHPHKMPDGRVSANIREHRRVAAFVSCCVLSAAMKCFEPSRLKMLGGCKAEGVGGRGFGSIGELCLGFVCVNDML